MKRQWLGRLIIGILGLLLLPVMAVQAAQAGSQPLVVTMTAEGPLTPVMLEVIGRGIDTAVQKDAELLVIHLNTPGGSVDLMNKIVQRMLASPVPIVVYISPRGGMAASAGTLITLAADIAAMAPETAIGAASPVGSQGEDIQKTLERKEKEILKATARSLAESRGAAAVALAEDTIENAKAASAHEALQVGLVDYIAVDLSDLLKQLDGKSVVINGGSETIITRGASLLPVEPTPVEKVLNLLTNPNLVFLLLSIGVQAILIELSSPGGWVAGFIGAVFLALAVYGLGILPVNYFGLIFLVIAFVLFILDIKAPTHGALTVAGTASFIAGALILFNSLRVPGFPGVSVGLVIGTGIITAASFFAIISLAWRAMRIPVSSGREGIAHREGLAMSDLSPKGIVQVAGEQWTAEVLPGAPFIQRGERVRVVEVRGVRLLVEQAGKE